MYINCSFYVSASLAGEPEMLYASPAWSMFINQVLPEERAKPAALYRK